VAVAGRRTLVAVRPAPYSHAELATAQSRVTAWRQRHPGSNIKGVSEQSEGGGLDYYVAGRLGAWPSTGVAFEVKRAPDLRQLDNRAADVPPIWGGARIWTPLSGGKTLEGAAPGGRSCAAAWRVSIRTAYLLHIRRTCSADSSASAAIVRRGRPSARAARMASIWAERPSQSASVVSTTRLSAPWCSIVDCSVTNCDNIRDAVPRQSPATLQRALERLTRRRSSVLHGVAPAFSSPGLDLGAKLSVSGGQSRARRQAPWLVRAVP
jgi:hypothetical protein